MRLVETQEPNSATATNASLAEGRRKVVTMMFADIVNSSSLVIGRDPEAANNTLLPMLQGMIDAVHQYGGTVLQILGDGIMAAFGAPEAQEDHALRACLAAEQMRRDLGQWPTHSKSDPERVRGARIRVGINSGEVLAQELLADRWPEYRAAGEAVYIAARLAEAAKPGVILLSAETEAIVRDAVATGERRSVHLGKQLPRAAAVELLCVRPAGARLQRVNTAPFVGRARERGLLDDALLRAGQGSGEIVVLQGDAGIGESRLVTEFEADAHGRGNIVVRAACYPPHLFVPLPPVVEALRSALTLLGVARPDDVSAERALVHLTPLHRAAVAQLLGGAPADAQWQSLGPTERRHLTLSACVEVFEQLARGQQTLVLLFEDVHWADSDLGRLIDLLSVRVHLGRTLVVMTRRPGADFQDTPWPSTSVIDVDPLSGEDCAELVGAVLGRAPFLAPLRDLLVDKTGGNPFFLLECLAAVAESGPLTGRAGPATVQSWCREFAVPPTIQTLVAARIDRLDPADQELLSRAAVIGQTFAHHLLARIVSDRREHQLAALNRLCQAGFLQRTRVVPHLEFSFKHALIHDVTYGSLPRTVRKSLHAALVAALRSPSLEIPNRLSLLAQHSLCSEQWARAFVFGLAAGRDALRRSQHREAAKLLEGAVQALDKYPRVPRNRARAAQARLDLADAYFPLGRRIEAERQLVAAQRAARGSANLRVLTRAWCGLTLHHWVAGNLNAAYRTGARASRSAEENGYADLRLVCLVRVGSIAMEQGRCRLARKHLEQALDLSTAARGSREPGLLVVTPAAFQGPLALALAHLGLYREAVGFADKAVTAAQESGHLFSQVYALMSAGNVYIQKGDFDRSAEVLGQALRLCRMIGATLLVRQIVGATGYSLLHLGRVEEGCALLEDAVASATSDPTIGQLPQHLGWLALGKLAVGKHAEATVVARRAIGLARRNGQRAYEAWGWYALSRAQHVGDARGAIRSLERARAIASRCGLHPLVARTEGGWGASEPLTNVPETAPQPIVGNRARDHLRVVGKDEAVALRDRLPIALT